MQFVTTLGIETSGDSCRVAVRGDGRESERILAPGTGARSGQALVPELQSLLADEDLRPAQIDVIGVSVGPGRFTGLRIGIVCAKTLAYATGAKLVAVDTMDVLARQAAASADPPDAVQIAIDAFRGELFVARYRIGGASQIEMLSEVSIIGREQWLASLTASDCVAGPLPAAIVENVRSACRLLPADVCQPRASTVADIAESRAASGQVDDLWTLEPRYLRRSAAEEKEALNKAR